MSASILRTSALNATRASTRAAPSALRAQTRGFAAAVPHAKDAVHHQSMMPVEVYPLLGIITGALSFGLYVGYSHLRYDGTVAVMNRHMGGEEYIEPLAPLGEQEPAMTMAEVE